MIRELGFRIQFKPSVSVCAFSEFSPRLVHPEMLLTLVLPVDTAPATLLLPVNVVGSVTS